MPTDILWTGPAAADAAATLILAHGAGAPMDSGWMTETSELLGERGIRVARFEFAYMAGRREGRRRAAPKAETAIEEYRAVVAQVRSENARLRGENKQAAEENARMSGGGLFIGGKSYGGRVASLVADELHDAGVIRGLVCLGYPFHPPGKPEQVRTAHLTGIRTPTLICQGERDPFGGPDEVATYGLSAAVTVRWFADGDHGLRPRKASGMTEEQHLATAADEIAGFMRS